MLDVKHKIKLFFTCCLNVKQFKQFLTLSSYTSPMATLKNESKKMSEAASAMGKKGGPARAKALSASRRSEIAQKAAAARWGNEAKKK